MKKDRDKKKKVQHIWARCWNSTLNTQRSVNDKWRSGGFFFIHIWAVIALFIMNYEASLFQYELIDRPSDFQYWSLRYRRADSTQTYVELMTQTL